MNSCILSKIRWKELKLVRRHRKATFERFDNLYYLHVYVLTYSIYTVIILKVYFIHNDIFYYITTETGVSVDSIFYTALLILVQR